MSAFIWSFLGGLLLHQTSTYTRKMPSGWEQLASPAIGVIGTSPFFALWLKRLGGEGSFSRCLAAFYVSFLGVGCGVATGWLLDTIFGISRDR